MMMLNEKAEKAIRYRSLRGLRSRANPVGDLAGLTVMTRDDLNAVRKRVRKQPKKD